MGSGAARKEGDIESVDTRGVAGGRGHGLSTTEAVLWENICDEARARIPTMHALKCVCAFAQAAPAISAPSCQRCESRSDNCTPKATGARPFPAEANPARATSKPGRVSVGVPRCHLTWPTPLLPLPVVVHQAILVHLPPRHNAHHAPAIHALQPPRASSAIGATTNAQRARRCG